MLTEYEKGKAEREAFEKAITVQGLHVNLTRIGPASSDAGEYADVIVQTCWRVWQLALAYEHEEQLARVCNVILAGIETTHLTEERARGIFKDITDILNISLEQ